MVMPSPNAPLSGEWATRFRDVEQLSAYAETQQLQLANAEIVDYDISRARMTAPEFESTLWQRVKAREMTVRGGVFRNSVLKDVHFDASILSNVRFENVSFQDVSFEGAQLQNVVFEDCEFHKASLSKLLNSTVEIVDSNLASSEFDESELRLVTKDSTLDTVDFFSMRLGSTIKVIDSALNKLSSTVRSSPLSSFTAAN